MDTQLSKPGEVWRFWREVFVLAWRETGLLSRGKLLTTLGVSIGALVFQYELNVRTLGVTVRIIGTVVLAYLIVALFGYLWNVIAIPALRSEKAQLENERLLDRLRQLTILFKPGQAPFEQTYPGVDGLPLTQYRVGMISPTPIPDAELVVNKFVIDGVEHSGCHLRPRHERNHATGGTKRVALKSFKEDFWDVVSTHPEDGVVLNAISQHGLIVIPAGTYEFELMATGGDNPGVTEIANLKVAADNSVDFDIREGRLSEQFLIGEEKAA